MNKKTTPKPVSKASKQPAKAKPRKKPEPKLVNGPVHYGAKELNPTDPLPAWTPPDPLPADDTFFTGGESPDVTRLRNCLEDAEERADRSIMAHTADVLAKITRKLEAAEEDVRLNKAYYEKALSNAMDLQAKYDRLLLILSQ